jgi:hypothetical protein
MLRLAIGALLANQIVLATGAAGASAADVVNRNSAARALVERAIDAQGGSAQVEKLFKRWIAKIEGTAGRLTITGTLSHDGPDRGRIATQLVRDGQTIEVIVVTDGSGRAWRKIGEVSQEVVGKELEEMKDGGWRSRKVRFLLPLLTDERIELSMLGESVVADRPAQGIRVTSKGHRDVDVYFDKETGWLAKMESRVKSPDNRDIVLEQVFSDYKEFDGVKLATTFTKYENGRQTSVERIVDIKFVDEIDRSLFARP